jgi:hypothetical protein
MLNRLEKLIRHFWHDVYYSIFSNKGVDFAMTCREATEKIDLSDQSKTSHDKLRVSLHISLCQACNNYYKFSNLLKNALKKASSFHSDNKKNLEKLNKDLLKKFSK